VYVRMKVDAVRLDEAAKSPVVILRDPEGGRLLPIWIGIFEAAAILFALEGVETPRPLTHDLLASVVEALGGTVERVDVSSLEDGVYRATLHLASPERDGRTVDCRPSDGLAVALRTNAPVFVEERVLREGGARPEAGAPAAGESGDSFWKEYLESLDPAAFGKYKM
jgi:bifunctional DNase/RNase